MPIFPIHQLPGGTIKHGPWRTASERDKIPLAVRDMGCCIVLDPYELAWFDFELGTNLKSNQLNRVGDARTGVPGQLRANDRDTTIWQKETVNATNAVATIGGFKCEKEGGDVIVSLELPRGQQMPKFKGRFLNRFANRDTECGQELFHRLWQHRSLGNTNRIRAAWVKLAVKTVSMQPYFLR